MATPERERWTTNLRRVEIEITTACNLECPNCDRSVPQAPSEERMSIEQIDHFLEESVELEWLWERISLLGGEPTLHPELPAIVESLDRYRARAPRTRFRIFSNGFGSKVQRAIAGLPPWLEVLNTEKTREPPLFSAYNIAPIDLPELAGEDFTRGCVITHWCGLGLTRYGYYPCGAGASLDRIFGFDLGLKSLREVDPKKMVEQLRKLCGLCGHFRDFDQRVEYVKLGDKRALSMWTREAQVSPSWEAAYARYAAAAPRLTLY